MSRTIGLETVMNFPWLTSRGVEFLARSCPKWHWKWGPASPAPNVDRNGPGPTSDPALMWLPHTPVGLPRTPVWLPRTPVWLPHRQVCAGPGPGPGGTRQSLGPRGSTQDRYTALRWDKSKLHRTVPHRSAARKGARAGPRRTWRPRPQNTKKTMFLCGFGVPWPLRASAGILGPVATRIGGESPCG